MTRRMRLAMAFGLLVLFTAASLSAHHAFAPVFDGNKVVNLKGTVTRFEMVNPHSFIYLDVKGENGQLEHFALEGPAIRQLDRLGVGTSGAMLKAGDVIEVCGYATKDGVQSVKGDPSNSASGRLISAELVVFPDGQRRVWSNYGQRKCLDPR